MILNYYSHYPEGLKNYIPDYFNTVDGEINIYTDDFIIREYGNYKKNPLALLVEPRSIIPHVYEFVEEHFNEFLYVFTFDSKLLKLPNAKLYIYGQVQVSYPHDEKTKMISMACSDKDMCEGHRQRRTIANMIKDKIDVYGKFNGGEYASYKEIYSGYKFNVAMENYADGHYFTEKICNCFASKIVPIYYGCPNIGQYFNSKGIFVCKTVDAIPYVIDVVLEHGDDIYDSLKPYIEENYNLVWEYEMHGKYFFEMYGELLKEIAR